MKKQNDSPYDITLSDWLSNRLGHYFEDRKVKLKRNHIIRFDSTKIPNSLLYVSESIPNAVKFEEFWDYGFVQVKQTFVWEVFIHALRAYFTQMQYRVTKDLPWGPTEHYFRCDLYGYANIVNVKKEGELLVFYMVQVLEKEI